MLMKIKNNLCIRSKIEWVLPWPRLHPSTKFHKNPANSFSIVLLIDKNITFLDEGKIWKNNKSTEMNEIAISVKSSSNHSCSLTPGLLIAMQLQVQLGNLAGPCHKINCNQLHKDIWFWMVVEEQWIVLKAFFKRALSNAAICGGIEKDGCHQIRVNTSLLFILVKAKYG